MKIIYQANDDTLFDSALDCIEYEKGKCSRINEFILYVNYENNIIMKEDERTSITTFINNNSKRLKTFLETL